MADAYKLNGTAWRNRIVDMPQIWYNSHVYPHENTPRCYEQPGHGQPIGRLTMSSIPQNEQQDKTEVRECEVCGIEHSQTNSPLCGPCRYRRSKRPCPIDGCETLIAPGSTTCLKHRPVNGRTHTQVECVECGQDMISAARVPVCSDCQKSIRILCACGCGNYRKKYDTRGHSFRYISGHNDAWEDYERPTGECAVCGEVFTQNHRKQILCGIDCRTRWLTINPSNERKRVRVNCSECGKVIFRTPCQMGDDRDYACSKECQYKIVARKNSGNITQPKLLVLQRDNERCVICGFDTIVHVHHIKAKRNGGKERKQNLVTLCPNHHAMADRGMISKEELGKYV